MTKRYTFVVEAVISSHLTVEAGSLKEAVEKASGASMMTLCHQCASGSSDEWSTSGELDADPFSSKLVSLAVDDEIQSPAELRKAIKLWGSDDHG